jgi:hypothetical protein
MQNLNLCEIYNDTRPEGYKAEIGNQSQISSIWLAEMVTIRHFSQSDAWDLRLVSILSFITLGPDYVMFQQYQLA